MNTASEKEFDISVEFLFANWDIAQCRQLSIKVMVFECVSNEDKDCRFLCFLQKLWQKYRTEQQKTNKAILFSDTREILRIDCILSFSQPFLFRFSCERPGFSGQPDKWPGHDPETGAVSVNREAWPVDWKTATRLIITVNSINTVLPTTVETTELSQLTVSANITWKLCLAMRVASIKTTLDVDRDPSHPSS